MKYKVIVSLSLALLFCGCSQKKISDISDHVTSTEMQSFSDHSEQSQITATKEKQEYFVDKEPQNKVTSSNSEIKETDIPQIQTENKKEPLPQNTAEITASIPDSVQDEEPSIILATEKDYKAVAQQTVHYLNEYRKEQGVSPAEILAEYIPYAEYRSRQLVSNFAHDTLDERAAATALQVGSFIDPSEYGMDGEPYYVAGAREAIAMTGFVGTVEEVVNCLATLIRNSPDHWAYVGSAEYTKIAVGVTYAAGRWVADVAMKN